MYSDVYRLFMTTVIFLCQLLVVSKVNNEILKISYGIVVLLVSFRITILTAVPKLSL